MSLDSVKDRSALKSLVIVDDEKIIRDGLRTVVDWEALGFAVVGSYCNGLEAFDAVRRSPVDVVLADIRMPKVDGLQLAERMQRNGISSRVVILSGHEKFEYARRAVDLNAVSYLLKPVKEDQIREVFTRIGREIDDERRMARDHHQKESVELRRTFAAVVAGKRPADTLQPLFRNASGNAFVPLLFELASGAPRTTVDGTCEDLTGDPRVLAAAPLDEKSNRIAVLAVLPGGGRGPAAARKLFLTMKSRLDGAATVTGGIGPSFRDHHGIRPGFDAASRALRRRVHEGVGRLYVSTDRDPAAAPHVSGEGAPGAVDIASLADAYALGLYAGDSDLAADMERRLLQVVASLVVEEVSEAADGLSSFFFHVRESSRRIGAGLHTGSFSPEAERRLLDDCESIPELARRLAGLRASELSVEPRHPGVTKAVSYIMNTIAGDLSLVSVATIAEMSPTHLSRLFKSILGVNFKDFVTGVRIRTARHYLEETAMLVYEIAERVGIPDGRYFSDVFRREVGCTPSEYRARAARTFGLPAVETIRP